VLTRPLRMELRSRVGQSLLATLCAFSLALGDPVMCAVSARQQDGSAQTASRIPDDQLDSLVAPIALYPDPLLSQVLVASTYPLEIIQLQQWLGKHKNLTGEALAAAVEKEDWDPSIQGMAVLPDVVDRLAENIKWTTDLGNTFLAQQSDVMDAVQRMRMKAKDAGNLKSNEQTKVETKVVETKTVVVVQQVNPQVVYVPMYNPVVVYGPPVYLYPYPRIYYPPPGYYGTSVVIGFGSGVVVGSYYRGGWGYYCGWGQRTTININVNNRYVSHYNTTKVNNRPTQLPAGTSNTWQHNPQHRGGTPYSNQQIAKQYGGTARGDSFATRQANARQQQGLGNNRPQTSQSNRAATGPSRTGSSAAPSSRTGAAAGNRAGANAGTTPSNMVANRSAGGDKIGNRQIPSSDAARSTTAFGGPSSKSNALASSARGSASMGGSRGGGMARSAGKARKTT